MPTTSSDQRSLWQDEAFTRSCAAVPEFILCSKFLTASLYKAKGLPLLLDLSLSAHSLKDAGPPAVSLSEAKNRKVEGCLLCCSDDGVH